MVGWESVRMSQQNSNSNSADEYKRTTLYLRESVKRHYERWQLRLELEHTLVEDAYKREFHEALIAVAMNNSDEFTQHLEDCVDDPEDFEVAVEEISQE
jgi:hypothetical protein